MKKYKSKPVVIEAIQWFKNGDHPKDNLRKIYQDPQSGSFFWSEGEYIRRFASLDHKSEHYCTCGKKFKEHGFLDTAQGGHRVCPGDWVMEDSDGIPYPCKDSVFQTKYEELNDASISKTTTT